MHFLRHEPLDAGFHEAEASKAGRDWVLQHDFEASSLGACTVICWRPHTACLPPMIAAGDAAWS